MDDLIARDWWLFHALSTGDRTQRLELEHGRSASALEAWNAREAVERLIEAGGPDALRAVLDLLRAAPAGRGPVEVGAGPLEDLMHQHGDDLATEIADLARRDPLFAETMSHVWL